ncbi:MAG: polysaccharide lyase, partial [Flavisolibacter sp.]|nr:polysaccharide lyase [Flavisolibacter sp.]
GIITHPSQVGGYPEYKGTPYKDADSDGMPDEGETKHGLNPRNAADASSDRNSDGYTNIEEYLNSVVDIKNIRPATQKQF